MSTDPDREEVQDMLQTSNLLDELKDALAQYDSDDQRKVIQGKLQNLDQAGVSRATLKEQITQWQFLNSVTTEYAHFKANAEYALGQLEKTPEKTTQQEATE